MLFRSGEGDDRHVGQGVDGGFRYASDQDPFAKPRAQHAGDRFRDILTVYLTRYGSVGAIVAFSQLVTNISFPIYSFSDMFSQIVSGKKLFKEIESSFVNVKKNNPEIQTISDFKNIKFDNVSVVYNSERVVKIGNLEISNDKKYVIHGPSGSGKTTLFKLLTKQILDYQGSILFNNINIKKIKDNSIFSQVSYLPQSGHIFSTTLINNLTLFNTEKYPKEDLFKVLRFVELKIGRAHV